MFLNYKQKKAGFTLIELSVVIVIIGLIVAGIVAGQSLVEQAKLRSSLSDANSIIMASNQFFLQYNAVAGDMNNADDYWSTSSVGNGDRAVNDGEVLFVWNHLGLADLIEEDFPGGVGPPFTEGVTQPLSGLNGSMFDIDSPCDGDCTKGSNGNANHLSYTSSRDNYRFGSALTASQALSIDQKLDDGLPEGGKVYASQGDEGSGTCFSGTSYLVQSSAVQCRLDLFYLP